MIRQQSILTVIACFLLAMLPAMLNASPVDVFIKIPDVDGEPVEQATNRIDELHHELTHVVQQKRSSSHEAAHVLQQGKGKSAIANVMALAGKIMAESKKLEKLYNTPATREGKQHARAIGADARQIQQLGKKLGPSPSTEEEAQFYFSVSERLRHSDRAIDGHKEWIAAVSGSQGQNIRKQMATTATKRSTAGGGSKRHLTPGTAQTTGDDDTSNKGGNAETTWKVEKGEK